jgi:hypothetical protein
MAELEQKALTDTKTYSAEHRQEQNLRMNNKEALTRLHR